MRVLLSAAAAKMGGAANYIETVTRELATCAPEDEFVVVLPSVRARALATLAPNVHVIGTEAASGSYLQRAWFDQITLRRCLARERIDVLYSTANFSMFLPPCPQLLLVRNALYYSPLYLERVYRGKPWRARIEIRLRRWLNCLSIRAADLVMTPTQAMMDDVQRFVPVPASKAMVNHYGVDVGRFRPADAEPLPGVVRLVYPSLYGEHKNLATLFRALAELASARVDFVFTTPADPNRQDAHYTCTWQEDARMAADPVIRDRVRFVPARNASEMVELYRTADVMVYPSPVESFGHPLLEALASGLPVVAADCAVNRELCGEAALYFRPFDAADFSRQVQRVIANAELRANLKRLGPRIAASFTWGNHVRRLLQAFRQLAGVPDRVAETEFAAEERSHGSDPA